MLRIAAATAAILVTLTATAEARSTPNGVVEYDRHAINQSIFPRPIKEPAEARCSHHGCREAKRSKRSKKTVHNRSAGRIASPSSLGSLTPGLATKAKELIEACGAKIISGHRPGARIAGSRHASLHARYPSEAVDMTGDTSCIYPKLKGWAGGYSVDYAAVRHIHISLAHDRKERGARFAHYGTRRYARR